MGMADAAGAADDLMAEARKVRSIRPEGRRRALKARQSHIPGRLVASTGVNRDFAGLTTVIAGLTGNLKY